MTFLGEQNETYETVIFSICAGVAFLLFLFQIIYLQKLKSLSVRLLPLLTLAICYENGCSATGDIMSEKSAFTKFSVIIIAAILPLFIIVLFELPFRLHEARSAHFMCIPFEQGVGQSQTIAYGSLYFVRIVAVGLFVVNVLVYLDLLHDENSRAGLGGYANIDEETESTHFWLSVIPSMVMAALALFISILMQRYARNFTLGIRNSNHYWRYMLPCSVLYTVGQCFGAHIYRWTSMTGDVFMVIGISIMVHRVQSDLAVAGSFADFLHRSNAVFRTSQPSQRKEQELPPPQKKRNQHNVAPDDIHLEQLENGVEQGVVESKDKDKKEEEEEEEEEEEGKVDPMVEGGGMEKKAQGGERQGIGSTALVKSDRSLIAREEGEAVDLYIDDMDGEPELHAL